MCPPPDRRFDPKQDRGRRGPGSSRFGPPRSRWSREGDGEGSEGRERPDRPRRTDRGDRADRPERRPFNPRRPFRERSTFSRSSPDRDRSAPAAGRPQRSLEARPRSIGRPVSFNRVERRSFTPAPPSDRSDEPRGEAASHAAETATDLVWGRHAVLAVLESGRPVHRIWCTTEMRFSPRFMPLLREAKASGVLLEEVSWARLGQISAGGVHQGIVLQPAAAESLDLPSLIDGCRGIGEAPLLVAVDGLTDPQNLGAIVRSAEALGAHGLVLPQRRNAGLTGSVAKVAAGALEHLPVARVVNLNRALDSLKQEGYRVIGLAAEGTTSLEEADLGGPLVLVTGSEADGLSMLTRRSCDQLVRIPLRGATPSLNAAVATALLLYEVARRGWMRGLGGSSPAPRLVRPPLPAPPAPTPEPVATPQAEVPARLTPMPGASTPAPLTATAPPVPEQPAPTEPVSGEPAPGAFAPGESAPSEPALQQEDQPELDPSHAADTESPPAPPLPARMPTCFDSDITL